MLVGTPFDQLPARIATWQKVDPSLLSVIDINGDGILQLGEMKIGSDIIVLATREIGGMPYGVSGRVAAGGLAAPLSTADGLLLTIASALSRDVYDKMRKRANRWGASLGMAAGLGTTCCYMLTTEPWLRGLFGSCAPAELGWGIQPISAGVFGVPVGLATIARVSLLTPAPGKALQDLVDEVRCLAPGLGRVSDVVSGYRPARRSRQHFARSRREDARHVGATAFGNRLGIVLEQPGQIGAVEAFFQLQREEEGAKAERVHHGVVHEPLRRPETLGLGKLGRRNHG